MSNPFFAIEEKNKDTSVEEWETFKFDLLSMRKNGSVWKINSQEITQSNSIHPLYGDLNKTKNCEEYPIISSFAKIAYIITNSNAWPGRGESAWKRIKINNRSTLKNDGLNALLMVSLNGPQLGSLEARELVKHTSRIYGE